MLLDLHTLVRKVLFYGVPLGGTRFEVTKTVNFYLTNSLERDWIFAALKRNFMVAEDPKSLYVTLESNPRIAELLQVLPTTTGKPFVVFHATGKDSSIATE